MITLHSPSFAKNLTDFLLNFAIKGIVHLEINFWYVLAYLKGILMPLR